MHNNNQTDGSGQQWPNPVMGTATGMLTPTMPPDQQLSEAQIPAQPQNLLLQEKPQIPAPVSQLPDTVESDQISFPATFKEPAMSEILALTNSVTWEQAVDQAQKLLDTGLFSKTVSTPERVIGVLQIAKDLKMPISYVAKNVDFIDGKPNFGVYLMLGLLRRDGIAYRIVEDFVPISETEARTTVEMMDTVEYNKIQEQIKQLLTAPPEVRDLMVSALQYQLNFTVQKFSFLYSEAFQQGLLDKTNWKKYTRTMMAVAAIRQGARFFRPESQFGFHEIGEMQDALNKANTQDYSNVSL